jgi:hypothetical protein
MSLLGPVLVLEMTTLLNDVQYRCHMHEKGLMGPILVPHRKVECGGVLLERSLDLEVSQLRDFFLDLVFLGDVGDRWWLT